MALRIAVVGIEMGLFVTSAIALVVLENLDALGRRWSATGALIQFGVVAFAGWWLIPAAGALGGFAAFVLGEIVRTAVLRTMVARRQHDAGVDPGESIRSGEVVHESAAGHDPDHRGRPASPRG
jgi:hypothetical protein